MQRRRYRATQPALLLLACLIVVAGMWPLGIVRAVAAPVLTLEPDTAPCDDRTPGIIVRGQHFPPAQEITLTAFPMRANNGVQFASTTVAADGTFAFAVELRLLGIPCGVSGSPPIPPGSQYRISATIALAPPARATPLATTLFTVAAPSPARVPTPPGLEPVLTLLPDRGPCTERIVARGTQFPVGRAVTLTALQTGPGSGRSSAYRVFARPIVAANGAFSVAFTLPPIAPHGCGQCGVNGCRADPTGEQYTITAISDRGPSGESAVVARTTFTVDSATLPPVMPRAGGGAPGGALAPIGLLAGIALLAIVGVVALRPAPR